MKTYFSAFLLLTIANAVYAKSRSGLRGSKPSEHNHEQRFLNIFRFRLIFGGSERVKTPFNEDNQGGNEWDMQQEAPAAAQDRVRAPFNADNAGANAWDAQYVEPAVPAEQESILDSKETLPWDQP
uniref:Uncharacterized protein n=1 Tax=Asterionellopsis glacialis TaxID=33640 RepID=A0A6T9YF35_9STRA|mmetsp:Transcript_1832/g.2644  ORF Transcript_1832/g.2644 Transcript_1832/m.2644 type:complete len:126 (+) Transcript_1832:46-423(+)